MTKYLVVGLGGFLGANARFWLATWAAERFGATFPWGTLIINVSGSFLIGLILTYLSARVGLSVNYRLLLATGFLGAYTTFSTFTFESLTLLRDGSYLIGFANLLGSLALGLMAVFGGYLVGRAV